MKILHVANELVSTGNGIVNSAVDLACMQAEAGHSVSFVSAGGGYVDLLAEYKIHHHNVHMYVRSGWPFIKSLPQLRKIVRAEKPDIVHAHMMTGAVLLRIGRDLASFGDYGLITTVHNEWRLTSNLMQAGDRVIVLSENGRRAFERRGFPNAKMHVVRHGILQSPRRRDEVAARKCAPDRKPPIIATVAGLYRRKGVGDLIRAFGAIADEFPDAALHIVGAGPDREDFEKLRAATRGADRIHFKGFVAKPYRELREASVFVLASHTEAFPLAVAEAREAGCAIIATTVGGHPRIAGPWPCGHPDPATQSRSPRAGITARPGQSGRTGKLAASRALQSRLAVLQADGRRDPHRLPVAAPGNREPCPSAARQRPDLAPCADAITGSKPALAAAWNC